MTPDSIQNWISHRPSEPNFTRNLWCKNVHDGWRRMLLDTSVFWGYGPHYLWKSIRFHQPENGTKWLNFSRTPMTFWLFEGQPLPHKQSLLSKSKQGSFGVEVVGIGKHDGICLRLLDVDLTQFLTMSWFDLTRRPATSESNVSLNFPAGSFWGNPYFLSHNHVSLCIKHWMHLLVSNSWPFQNLLLQGQS